MEVETLKQILGYVGADTKYAYYAQVQNYLEWYAKRKLDEYISRQTANDATTHALNDGADIVAELHAENKKLKAEIEKLKQLLSDFSDEFHLSEKRGLTFSSGFDKLWSQLTVILQEDKALKGA